MEYLAQHIESLIFTCEQPISYTEIKAALEDTFETKFKEEEIKATIQELTESYQSDTRSFELVKIAGGFQFLTKGAFHATVGTFLKQTIKKRLSKAALETLAVIAYKQPVTKTDIENIRGVNCDYAAQKLLEKELISIVGRKEAPGRPLLYGTSQKFMDYFGIENLQDLPKLKEFQPTENSIGEAAPIEESAPGDYSKLKREDDVVDIAIAVANIYQPLPPVEDIEEDHQTDTPEDDIVDTAIAVANIYHPLPSDEDEDTGGLIDGDDNDGTPVADQEVFLAEEGAVEETLEVPLDLTEAAEETDTPEASVEFVQETVGEFAGQTNEEILAENDLAVQPDNFTGVEDVINAIEEETTPIQEED